LNLRKIIKNVATRCQILRLKFTIIKIEFGWGSAPNPAGGTYSTPQTLEQNIGDVLLREGNGCRQGKGRRGREGRERKGSEGDPMCIFNFF